ncbi:MAG: hypothetical protein HKP55_08155, partial [Gammaproteobacteria bacterium]|nr:hypothetical protein [Gammaproteobacteria bacterium]
MKNYRQLIILLLLMLHPLTLFAAVEAGKFLFVFGKVELELADGSKQLARKGLALFEGTIIRSDKTGKAQIKLVDGGFFAVRPNTHLKIDEYAFNQKGRDNKGVVSLLKGTFRSISGAIAKENKNNVVVKTPIATIGIRGTDHEPAFIPVNDAAFPPDLQPGVYDRVNSGATFIENDAGRLNLGQDDVGFVAQPDQPPVKLDHVPGFFQNPNVSVDTQAETDEESQEVAQDEQTLSDEHSDEAVETAVDTVSEVNETLEATDASGNTINFDEQTITDADGTIITLEQVNPVTSFGESAHVAMLRYDSSAPAFKIIEMTAFIDGTREIILRDLSGHVYGGIDEMGEHIV